MRIKLSMLLPISVLAAVVAISACGNRGQDDNTIRIGAIVELTGDMPLIVDL